MSQSVRHAIGTWFRLHCFALAVVLPTVLSAATSSYEPAETFNAFVGGCYSGEFLHLTVRSRILCAVECNRRSDCFGFNVKNHLDEREIRCSMITQEIGDNEVLEDQLYILYTREGGLDDITTEPPTTMRTTTTTTTTTTVAPPPAPAPSSYTRLDNHDCSTGADLHFMNGGANDNQVCKDWCDAESNCGGFAFSFDGRCWFKDLSCVAQSNPGARYLYLKN